jgi:uncharacterized SAM-dependent methyltransferase
MRWWHFCAASCVTSGVVRHNHRYSLIQIRTSGAGDGLKTKELLKALNRENTFDYMPVDISQNALDISKLT